MPVEQSEAARVYPHAMLKEIYEQPDAIADTLLHYLATAA